MRRLLLMTGLVAAAAGGAAADALCGTTVTGDLKLDHDLVCSADGLVVGADGIRIDLNGHTIAGSGAGLGILVAGRSDVTIANGVIRNFGFAIRMNASTGIIIRQTQFVQNGEGIDAQAGSVGNTIKDNLFQGHTIRAIMLRGGSSDNDVKNNTFSGNRIGVLVFGGTDSELKDNLISGSSLAGIRFNVAATGNTIKDNILTSNVAGIDFVVTPHRFFSGERAQGEHLDRERMRTPGSDRRQHLQGQYLRGQRRKRLPLRPSRGSMVGTRTPFAASVLMLLAATSAGQSEYTRRVFVRASPINGSCGRIPPAGRFSRFSSPIPAGRSASRTSRSSARCRPACRSGCRGWRSASPTIIAP